MGFGGFGSEGLRHSQGCLGVYLRSLKGLWRLYKVLRSSNSVAWSWAFGSLDNAKAGLGISTPDNARAEVLESWVQD